MNREWIKTNQINRIWSGQKVPESSLKFIVVIGMKNKDLIEQLKSHQVWLKSAGHEASKLIVDEVDFQHVDLSIYSLKEARLIASSFDKMSLDDQNFILSWLCSSTFKGACMQYADFYKANVSYVDFRDANLSNTRFTDCESAETNFSAANLSNAKLNVCYFYRVDFRNATLTQADLTDSFFEKVLVNGANFKNVHGFDKAKIISINTGTLEEPVILKEEKATHWIMSNCM